MHKLKIEGRTIFLDGIELQSVVGYQLSDEAGGGAEITIKLRVNEVNVAARREQPVILSEDQMFFATSRRFATT